ncbi:COP9 signalosome complex subunit 6 [Xylariaceae sp. FL0016]|nr:COP9 signalosome complex subunit 6 [Xylariaceae sp. FL0016]
MESADQNPLLSSQKSSDSGLQAVLHPLVLLTISDYITRHTLREQPGPVIGALIGQQNGREVTIEHAFECATVAKDGEMAMDASWFAQRLTQMKTIHSSPQLDLVGWYTLVPKSGPTQSILPIHKWILSEHNESSLLLAFHPEEAMQHSAGSRLPLTIYESNYEHDEPKADHGEDKEMHDGEPPLKLKFRELSFSVETGEAEMISMDFVARGAGNATAIEPRQQKVTHASEGKGKQKAEPSTSTVKDVDGEEHVLSREDEEMIAALTAKANSIKMLQNRINLLITYLKRLPPSYLSGDSTTESSGDGPQTTPSHPILRSIQALVSRLSLVVPSNADAYQQEMLSEANDVHLMELLNGVMQSVTEARGVGKRYGVVEGAKSQQRKMMDQSTSFDSRFMGDLAV